MYQSRILRKISGRNSYERRKATSRELSQALSMFESSLNLSKSRNYGAAYNTLLVGAKHFKNHYKHTSVIIMRYAEYGAIAQRYLEREEFVTALKYLREFRSAARGGDVYKVLEAYIDAIYALTDSSDSPYS